MTEPHVTFTVTHLLPGKFRPEVRPARMRRVVLVGWVASGWLVYAALVVLLT
jgi:hypothetical protein